MSGMIFGILAVILAITLGLLRPKIKGHIGEKVVSAHLKTLSTNDYFIINDLILPTKRGTSQIDHIVVSKYGIFVIETKNYKGWIFGHENSEKWVQNIFGHKYEFVNPIRQNQSHIRAIRNTISNIGQFPLISVVAFSSKASLNVSVENSHVVHWGRLVSTIQRYQAIVIGEEQVQGIFDCLQQSNITIANRKKEHTKSVRQITTYYENTLAAGICPRCRGRLIERSGTYGRFYGCSNYPRCKFTHRY